METKAKRLPVYILLDTSSSMSAYEDLLNQSIEKLYDFLISSPRVSDYAAVSILNYNTRADVVLGITDLEQLASLPQLSCGGCTNFLGALRLLRERIDHDVPFLSDAGNQVFRPVVFVLTDGVPTDETGHPSENWKAEFEALIDPSYTRHPNVVPFGYGGATAQSIRAISTIPEAAFLAVDGGTADALLKIIPTLVRTLVASARDKKLRLPAEVDGFVRVNEDFIE